MIDYYSLAADSIRRRNASSHGLVVSLMRTLIIHSDGNMMKPASHVTLIDRK